MIGFKYRNSVNKEVKWPLPNARSAWVTFACCDYSPAIYDYAMTLSNRIEAAAQQRGVSMGYIAGQLGISSQYLSRIKNGAIAKSSRLPEIAAVLGVDAEWLATGNPLKSPAWAAPQMADLMAAMSLRLVHDNLLALERMLEGNQTIQALSHLRQLSALVGAVIATAPKATDAPKPIVESADPQKT